MSKVLVAQMGFSTVLLEVTDTIRYSSSPLHSPRISHTEQLENFVVRYCYDTNILGYESTSFAGLFAHGVT